MKEEHTPKTANAGQIGVCSKCKKPPIYDADDGKEHEVYDGCLGKLQGDIMNACCGHGSDSMAYIQYYSSHRIDGLDAIKEQRRLVAIRLD